MVYNLLLLAAVQQLDQVLGRVARVVLQQRMQQCLLWLHQFHLVLRPVLLVESPRSHVGFVTASAQVEPDALLALQARVPPPHNGAHSAAVAPHAKVNEVLLALCVAGGLENPDDPILEQGLTIDIALALGPSLPRPGALPFESPALCLAIASPLVSLPNTSTVSWAASRTGGPQGAQRLTADGAVAPPRSGHGGSLTEFEELLRRGLPPAATAGLASLRDCPRTAA